MEARDFHTCRPRVGQPKFFSTSLRSQGGFSLTLLVTTWRKSSLNKRWSNTLTRLNADAARRVLELPGRSQSALVIQPRRKPK
jgi:hypothetical protein